MQQYECKNCGAELKWNPLSGSLKCDYCANEYMPSDFEDKTIENAVTTEATSSTYAQEDLEDGMVVYVCDECGAEVVASETTMATECIYCGRPISITSKSVGEFRPEKIIPFSIDKTKAMELFTKYIKKFLLAPKSFREKQVIEKIQGLYIPFFLHDAHLFGPVSVTGEKVSYRRRGYDQIETHQVYKIEIDADVLYQYIPTDAAKKMANEVMDELEPFSVDKICPYNPAYMAGYFAEQADEKKELTFRRAKEKMFAMAEESSCNVAGSYSSKSADISGIEMKDYACAYAMLPVWILNITYKNKNYQYMINGDTGKVIGAVPISIIKLLGIPSLIVFFHALLSAISYWF